VQRPSSDNIYLACNTPVEFGHTNLCRDPLSAEKCISFDDLNGFEKPPSQKQLNVPVEKDTELWRDLILVL